MEGGVKVRTVFTNLLSQKTGKCWYPVQPKILTWPMLTISKVADCFSRNWTSLKIIYREQRKVKYLGDAAVMFNQTIRAKIQIIVSQCVTRVYKLSFNKGWQVSSPPHVQYLCGAQLDLRQVVIFIPVKFSYDIFHDLFFFLHVYNSDLSICGIC